MKKLLLLILSGSLALSASEKLLPAGNYEFNSRYIPQKVAGRYGWHNGLEYKVPLPYMP